MSLALHSRNGYLAPRRVDLFSEISKELDHAMNNIFGHDFFSGLSKKGKGYPLMDAIKTTDSWILQYSVPGVAKDDLTVELTEDEHGRLITVGGFLHEDFMDKNDNYAIKELSGQEFRRVVRLPEDIEDKDPLLSLKDGILRVKFSLKKIAAQVQKVKKLTIE
jgi:HSP20 family molecular chaperone IbpA